MPFDKCLFPPHSHPILCIEFTENRKKARFCFAATPAVRRPPGDNRAGASAAGPAFQAKKGAGFCKSFSIFRLFKTFFVYIFYTFLASFVELLL